MFGKQPLHCGLVVRQEHRHWVHVVGTDYDLHEWDPPKPDRQGVGAPVSDAAPPAPAPGAKGPPKAPPVDPMALMLLCSQGSDLHWRTLSFQTFEPFCGGFYAGVEEGLARKALEATGGANAMAPSEAKLEAAMMWIFARPEEGAAPAAAAGTARRPGADFDGERFDRPLDCYSDAAHPVEGERWAVELLRPIIRALFPAEEVSVAAHSLVCSRHSLPPLFPVPA